MTGRVSGETGQGQAQSAISGGAGQVGNDALPFPK
jgi:hypothetical protein